MKILEVVQLKSSGPKSQLGPSEKRGLDVFFAGFYFPTKMGLYTSYKMAEK